MKRKKLISLVLVAVFVFSAISVFAIANYQTNSKVNYVQSIKCKAQGDIMPKALNDEILSSSNNSDQIILASIHGDFCPRPLKEEEYKDPEIIYLD